MKKAIYALILPLVVGSGIVFANRVIKNETKPSPKRLPIAAKKAGMADARKKWETSPDGIKYREWTVSPEGKKVFASHDKIRKYINTFSNMEAVVTSVTFERAKGKPGPKWLLVKINGEDYMMQFNGRDFKQLNGLKVNDKIIIKSQSVGYSPNHPYLIVSGDYIEQNNKVLFKRDFSKNDRC